MGQPWNKRLGRALTPWWDEHLEQTFGDCLCSQTCPQLVLVFKTIEREQWTFKKWFQWLTWLNSYNVSVTRIPALYLMISLIFIDHYEADSYWNYLHSSENETETRRQTLYCLHKWIDLCMALNEISFLNFISFKKVFT